MTSYFIIIFLTIAAFTSFLHGDSFAPSTTKTASSPEGKYLVRKIPSKKVKDQIALWPETTLIVYQLDEAQDYKETRRFEVAGHPDDMFVDDAGTWVVTLDESFGMGQGANVVVIYDMEGKILKKWSLMDIYDGPAIAKLRKSTSSIYWRGEVKWSKDQKSLDISNPPSLRLLDDKSYSISYNNEFPSFMLDLARLRMLPVNR